MLDSKEVTKIEQLVYSKPRSIQEIATHINKNWRTADRYVEEIQKSYGTIAIRTFREGTRGALKIVYWASIEKVSSSVFQEEIEKNIFLGKNKQDFSPFDMFLHVKDSAKNAFIYTEKEDEEDRINEMNSVMEQAEKQVLIFSGNLSLINDKTKKYDTLKTIENLAKKGVTIKIICRVDLAGKQNVERIQTINYKLGKESIDIRHRYQPVRGIIIDGKIMRIKEINEPTKKQHESQTATSTIYSITDKDWVEWLTKIFWKMFSNSVSAEKRILEMNKLKTHSEHKLRG